ncbi:hypothetical protein C8035_v012422 [Colletotrichum spinosum]|uniref:Inhibitor I9 domain-containing protein n=1 Tax=Colletotrichum spinosum TaxID=1347390 RepID=A0A4R8Q5J9_9PEZI|nr:hypothetical protein C8035_v012422 [Colletotrichum spinosum]
MRFTTFFALSSLASSVLAGRYIVLLKPDADFDSFVAELQQGGDAQILRRYDYFPFLNGGLIGTVFYNEASLRKFPQVDVAEKDKIYTIGPVVEPVPVPGPTVPIATE